LQGLGRNGRMKRDNGDPLAEEQCRFGYMQNEGNQSNSSTCVADSCVFNAKFKVVNHRQCNEKSETQVAHTGLALAAARGQPSGLTKRFFFLGDCHIYPNLEEVPDIITNFIYVLHQIGCPIFHLIIG
jgi:hypothetical protein